jgi:D-alanyl-D-alanine carboxypeptidase
VLLALLRLSPHNRFRTAFLTAASVRDGTVGRELYLKGDGDLELVLEERSGCC